MNKTKVDKQLKEEENLKKEIKKEVTEKLLNSATLCLDEGIKKIIVDYIDEKLYSVIAGNKWEWLHVAIDDKFRVEQLNKYGEQGWAYAFIHEPRLVKESWKNKPSTICLYRPKPRKSDGTKSSTRSRKGTTKSNTKSK